VSFIDSRLRGFEKDIRICLTPVRAEHRPGVTHAYFPGLATCCATLEYLTALHRGNTEGIGWQQVRDFASAYLPQPAYNAEVVKVLFSALRHPVAHRGIASGVWVERPSASRRVVWKVTASALKPACSVVAEPGVVKKDSPWPTRYTHRVLVHLRRFALDLGDAAARYAQDIPKSQTLLRNFERCMHQLYPA
jgi:hypothetical protein